MQWSERPGAGFTSGEPWLPLALDYGRCNVEAQSEDPSSMLSLYRRLIELRKREPALAVGTYAPVITDGDVLAYVRQHGDSRFLVVLNFGPRSQFVALEQVGGGTIVLATDRAREGEAVRGRLPVLGDEGALIRLESAP